MLLLAGYLLARR